MLMVVGGFEERLAWLHKKVSNVNAYVKVVE